MADYDRSSSLTESQIDENEYNRFGRQVSNLEPGRDSGVNNNVSATIYDSSVLVGTKNIIKGDLTINHHYILQNGKVGDDFENKEKEAGFGEQVFQDKIFREGDVKLASEVIVNGKNGGLVPISSGGGGIQQVQPIINITRADESNKKKLCDKLYRVSFIGVACAILIATFLLIWLYTTNVLHKKIPQPYAEQPNHTDGDEHHIFRFRKRNTWLAQPSKRALKPITLPVPEIVILHSATNTCSNIPECNLEVKSIQVSHMRDKNWDDIGYHFLIGGNGYVYEGRGWYSVGQNVRGRDPFTIGIAFIGNFTTFPPTQFALKGLQKLLKESVNYNRIQSNYTLYAHCQWSDTESPGKLLYNEITKMPHWRNNTGSFCGTTKAWNT